METRRGTNLLAVHLPRSLWDAMGELKKRTGRNRSDQAREALMLYFGISDLSQPFRPKVRELASDSFEVDV